MKIFGPRAWGPALDEQGLMTETPVGELCARCKEPIVAGESGALIWHADLVNESFAPRPWHRECHMRSVFGSAGHQRGLCSCRGGTEEDPPELSVRDAARLACAIAEGKLK